MELVIVALLLMQAPPAAEATPSVPAATLEVSVSPDTVMLGDRVTLTVIARHKEDVRLFFPAVPEVAPFRVLGESSAPERSMQQGTLVETWSVTVTPLRIGRRKIPPFAVDLESGDGQTAVLMTPPVAIMVQPRIDMDAPEIAMAATAI